MSVLSPNLLVTQHSTALPILRHAVVDFHTNTPLSQQQAFERVESAFKCIQNEHPNPEVRNGISKVKQAFMDAVVAQFADLISLEQVDPTSRLQAAKDLYFDNSFDKGEEKAEALLKAMENFYITIGPKIKHENGLKKLNYEEFIQVFPIAADEICIFCRDNLSSTPESSSSNMINFHQIAKSDGSFISHHFHEICSQPWFDKSSSCPNCQTTVAVENNKHIIFHLEKTDLLSDIVKAFKPQLVNRLAMPVLLSLAGLIAVVL